MKRTSVLVIFGFIGVHCWAQNSSLNNLGTQQIEKAARLRNAGVGLTLVGGLCFAIGLGIALDSSITTISNGNGTTQTYTDGNPELGAGLLLVGIGGLGSGLPLWIVGGKRHSRYKRMQETVSMGFSISPNNTGLKLALRF